MARLQGGRDAVESGFWGQIGQSNGSLFCPKWPDVGPGSLIGILKNLKSCELIIGCPHWATFEREMGCGPQRIGQRHWQADAV